MRGKTSALDTIITWKSLRLTFGTSMLWVDGHKSSYFLLVNISSPTKCTWILIRGGQTGIEKKVEKGTDLCVSVFASLTGAHLHYLTGSALNHNETVLTEWRALDRISGWGSGRRLRVLDIIAFHITEQGIKFQIQRMK